MTRKTQTLPLALLTLLFMFSSHLQAQEGGKVKEMMGAKSIPQVDLQDLKGAKVDASKVAAGKITVFSFWATWCSPCKKELNNIHDLYEDWVDDYDMQLVAVSIDDSRNKAQVKSYVNGQGWDYVVLLDMNEDLKRSLGFPTVPYTILVDQNGKIVYEHSGYIEGNEYDLEDKIAELAGN